MLKNYLTHELLFSVAKKMMCLCHNSSINFISCPLVKQSIESTSVFLHFQLKDQLHH